MLVVVEIVIEEERYDFFLLEVDLEVGEVQKGGRVRVGVGGREGGREGG